MDHMSLCISENETVRTAMDRLNCASMKILFVTDAAGRFSETLTDGDIRRYLLANGTLDAAVSKAGNCSSIPLDAAWTRLESFCRSVAHCRCLW